MKIVVGLGNPGEAYSLTRHNLGYRAAESFCRLARLEWSGRDCASRIARGRMGSSEVLVAMPETFMNASGEAVGCLLERSGASPTDLLVVCDDAAIDLGLLRVRARGSDGGHRGLRSIAEHIGTEDFPRLRIGIRTPSAGLENLSEHVLSPFSAAEQRVVEAQMRRAAECIQTVLEQGISRAMNRYNRKQPAEPQDPNTPES
ncbi:MAG: aminoacyl-tRNA hydrolase [Acidobacteria bacterium]|nr:aminoacyl-tRNA hydrolase [Acidobacteriota bacterium]